MVSLKARFYVLVLKLLKRKQAMMTAESLHETIKARRQTSDYKPNEKVCARLDVEQREIGGFPTYIVKPKGKVPEHHVFYLHGGAYTFEIIPPHWAFVADMAHLLNATVMVPIYPLAPGHDVQAALAYVHEAYAAFEAQAEGASLHLLGDSAGAGMALAALQQRRDAGKNMPANLFMISPFVEVLLDNPAIPVIDANDPWLAPEGLREAGRLYAGDLDVKDPRVSPLYGDMAGLPPVYIHIGTRDILQPDAKFLADKIRDAGGVVEYHEYRHMFHCWAIGTAPESWKARRAIADVIKGTAAQK